MFSLEVAKVTSKGQITIPVSIRRRLNINEGDKILFIDRPDGVIMVNPDMIRAEQGSGASAAQSGASAAQSPASGGHAASVISMSDSKPGADSGGNQQAAKDSGPATRAHDFDVGALLNEIRSIGSKI